MKILTAIFVTLFALPHITVAHAMEAAGWQSCIDMRNNVPAESELDCYRKIASDKRAEDETGKPILSSRATKLEQEWVPAYATLVTHKLNYLLLYAKSSQTNNSPTGPNPQNQVSTPSQQDDHEVQFQFSVKHDLADFDRYGSLWAGYTVISFWQLYDQKNSRPFRENNYEPELIYSINPDQLLGESKINPSIVNFGLVHQSNGQSNPRSRSWNRIYVQSGIERNYPNDRRLVLLLRGWQRTDTINTADDNADISKYLGYGDIELRYSQNKYWEATLLLRARSMQLDLAAPWSAWKLLTLASPGKHNTNIHLHYFSGYGESLIDYNHKHDTWGFGISFPFE